MQKIKTRKYERAKISQNWKKKLHKAVRTNRSTVFALLDVPSGLVKEGKKGLVYSLWDQSQLPHIGDCVREDIESLCNLIEGVTSKSVCRDSTQELLHVHIVALVVVLRKLPH